MTIIIYEKGEIVEIDPSCIYIPPFPEDQPVEEESQVPEKPTNDSQEKHTL